MSAMDWFEETASVSPADQKTEQNLPSNNYHSRKNNFNDVDEKPKAHEISLLNKLVRESIADDNDYKLDIVQSNPNKPLYSIRSFEQLSLSSELLKAVKYKGYLKPSKIQELALPALISGQNIIAQSQSGTGKTASFVLAALSKIDLNSKNVQCLVLSPTFELALQIAEVFRSLSQFMTGIKIFTAVKGEKVDVEEIQTSQVIIGTLGTTINWITKQRILSLENLKMFIIDEADVMIDEDANNSELCLKIDQLCPKNTQKLLFSATYSEAVIALALNLIPDSLCIRLKPTEEAVDDISHYYFLCNSDDSKFEVLCKIYSTMSIGQSIIFCRTRKQAAELSARMIADNHATAVLSGDLDVVQRASVMQRFRSGKERVLITTNVTARGIDIPSVNLVVNYSLPLGQDGRVDFETYLHRVGRTGRFGKKGAAINFIAPNQLDLLKSIEQRYSIKIKTIEDML